VSSGTAISSTIERSVSRGRALPPKLPPVDADELEPSDDEITKTNTLEKRMKEMSIDPMHPRFFGKSSSVMFLHTAMALKHTYAGQEPPPVGPDGRRKIAPCKRPEYWRAHSVSLPHSSPVDTYLNCSAAHQWVMESMENPKPHPHTNFPPEDLMYDLIDRFFFRLNLYIPLLHKPTFLQGMADKLYIRDEGFGSTVLLVCALGSRWSTDPRVILPGSNSTHSAGWEWFRQVQWVRRSLLSPPRLYDLQITCVSIFVQNNVEEGFFD
jgi:hypothetical protein